MSNILMLTGAMFMLEVYDRVLPSRSMATLLGLVVLVAGLYVALGILTPSAAASWQGSAGARRDAERPRLRHAGAHAVTYRQPQ